MDFVRDTFDFKKKEGRLWAAVYTRPLHEFRLHKYCRERGIPVYLPVVPDVKIHNVTRNNKAYTYKKNIFRPMLRSYLFAQMTENESRGLWGSKSVNRIWAVPESRQDAFVEELRGLRLMEDLAGTSELEFRKDLRINDRFIIESPRQYEGIYGSLLEKKKRFWWVICLELLGQSIKAEIDPTEFVIRKVE